MEPYVTYSMDDFWYQTKHRIIPAGRKSLAGCSSFHWHECCEIELVLSGTGTHFVNGTAHPIRPGMLYMLTPADNHRMMPDEPMELFGIMFSEEHVSAELFGRILELEAMGKIPLSYVDKTRAAVLLGYLEAIVGEEKRLFELDAQPGSDAFSESRIYIERLLDCILIELLRSLDAVKQVSSNTPVREAILYMYSHCTEPLTLDDLAGKLYLNSSYFSGLFRKITGQTFKSYLIRLRLAVACRLLGSSTLTVTEICYASGFTSYSHFMRTFREHYGISPMTYRRNHAAETKEETST